MRRTSPLVLLALLAGLLAPATPAHASVAGDLRARLHAALARSGASVVSAGVDVDGLGAVYRQAPDRAVLPASTEKLFTGLAALQALGEGTRLVTELRSVAAQRGPYLEGDLYLVAGGDPYLTGGQLDTLAAQLRAQGVRRITGRLVLDDTRYDAVRRAPGWKTAYVPEDSGPLSAMAVDGNGWRRDASYLRDPGLPTLDRLRSMLLAHGVSVDASLLRGRVPAATTTYATHVSASVTDLVRRALKDSDNFAAELLLKELGVVVRGSGTTEHGTEAVAAVLRRLGATVGTLADGSGLSSRDRQTATGELSLLAAAERSQSYAALRRALPIACVDGTLKKRLCGTAAARVAIAKTGTLPGTHALTGWTTTADGHPVRFAFLLSGASSGDRARAAIDQCVALLSAARTGG